MPTPEELLAVERISADNLATALRSDGELPVIIDVSHEDFELQGHIANAEHVPSTSFTEDADVDALMAKFSIKHEFDFPCVRSNTQRPTCALRFIERTEAAGCQDMLAGGFCRQQVNGA